MRTKKPDWAQRMVERNPVVDTGHGCYIHVADATKLLRAHHQKVKRMVQVLQQPKHGLCGYTLAQVLAKMKELER